MIEFLKNVTFAMEKCEPQISIFGIYHIVLFLASFAAFHYIIIKQDNSKKADTIAKVSTLLMLVLQLVTYAWYIITPSEDFFLKALPLYTCRMTLYLFVLGQFFGMKKCLRLATYWGVYGGVSGLTIPTVFHYPFPHVLQVATFILHVYIFLVGSYYLFVKKIGMDLNDCKWCIKITTGLILFNAVFNYIFGTNYISTRFIPYSITSLIGFTLPNWLCMPAVILAYIAVTYFQYWAANKAIRYMENKKERIRINNIVEGETSYDSE